MTTPKYYNADGSLTQYALACGYIDAWTADGAEFYGTDAEGVALSYNGLSYDVRVRRADVLDWRQFAQLGEARRFARAAVTAIRRGEPTPALDVEATR